MLNGHHCTLDSLYDAIVENEPKAVQTDLAKKIQEKAKELEAVTSENERVVKAAELAALIQQAAPAGAWEKVATFQTMGQLLNPKTAIRNIVGNAGFAAAETASDVLAASLDNVLSKFTGKRTKVMPQLGEAGTGFVEGAKAGLRDAMMGIDTTGAGTKFDLPKGQVFKNPVLKGLETALNIELRAADRAFYTMAYRESLLNQVKAAKVAEASEDMIARAHTDALYRTFQDKTLASKVFGSIKKVLNMVSPQSIEKLRAGKDLWHNPNDFGLGDLVLKYPKTPANILMRGLDYSPVGFFNGFYEIARPLIGEQFDQRRFVESISRATVGSGSAVGLGYYMTKLGLLTGDREQDWDMASVKSAQGVRANQLNASGLMRFVLNGFNPESAQMQPGDMLVSYDWFQPMAIPLSVGAVVAQNEGTHREGDTMTALGQVLGAVNSGANTLAEQPMLQGLQTLFGNPYGESKGIAGGIQEVAAGLPSSFVPTALSQFNQLFDNVSRETRGRNVYDTGLNRAKAKIPGLAQTLEPRRDVLGNVQERYQNGSNNIGNVLFNPAFVNKYQDDPLLSEIVRVYYNTGETGHALRNVPWKVVISDNGGGYTKTLSARERGQYQEYVGKVSTALLEPLIETSEYQALPDMSKADVMADVLKEVNIAAKMALFKHNPKRNPSLMAQSILMENPEYAHEVIMERLYKELDSSTYAQ